MKLPLIASTLFALLSSTYAQADDTSLGGLKSRVTGTWTSIACELRPALDPANPDGKPVPTYLTRDFTFDADDGFEASISIYADSGCAVPMMTFDFAGHIVWHDANPAAEGAWSQDYVLDRKLQITPKAEPMVAQLNGPPEGACGDDPFVLGETQDVLGKPCVLVRFVEGSDYVIDHDFLYVREDTPNMLFMGGKHVDGTGFYEPKNRPVVGLQQPMIRVSN